MENFEENATESIKKFILLDEISNCFFVLIFILLNLIALIFFINKIHFKNYYESQTRIKNKINKISISIEEFKYDLQELNKGEIKNDLQKN
jgi:hypothetical protein